MTPLTNITTAAPAALTAQASALNAEIASDQSQLTAIAAEFARRAALPQFPAPVIGINGVIPPAGHAVHVRNDLPDYYKGNDQLTTTVTDPTGAIVATQPGPNTAFMCYAPGTYTLHQVYNGVTAAPITFTVPAAGRVGAVAPTSNVNLKLMGTITKTVSFKGCQNVVCDCTDALNAVSGPAFDFDAASKNITVIAPYVNSPLVNGQPSGTGCQFHGENIALIRPRLGHVTDGWADNIPGATGLYIEGASEDSPTCNPGRLLFFVDTRDAAFVDCTAIGAVRESDVRTTAMLRPDGTVSDGLLRFLFLRCKFAQPSTGNKASLVLRRADQGLIADCEADLAPVSITSGGEPGVSTATQITRILFDNLKLVNCKAEVDPGASNITFRGGDWTAGDRTINGVVVGGGENLSLRKEPASFPFPVTGISVIGDGHVPGTTALVAHNNNHSFANVMGTLKPGDLTIGGVTLLTATPKLPFAKDANGPINMPGNVVKAGT